MSWSRSLTTFLRRGLRFHGYTPRWIGLQALLAAGIGTLISAFVYATLFAFLWHVPYWHLWPTVTGWLLLTWLLVPMAEVAEPPPAFQPDRAELPESEFRQVQRWERRIATTSEDPHWFTGVVRDRIATVVGERLRQYHRIRIDRAQDRDRVRAVLGDELHLFLTAPISGTPSPAELERLITAAERIGDEADRRVGAPAPGGET